MSQWPRGNRAQQFTPSPFHAVVLLNRWNVTNNITLEFSDLFDNNLCLSPPPPPNWTAFVRDLWLHEDLGEFVQTWTAVNVARHGVRMITFLLHDTIDTHP